MENRTRGKDDLLMLENMWAIFKYHFKNIYLLIARVENEIRSWNIMNIRVRSLNLIQKLMRKH